MKFRRIAAMLLIGGALAASAQQISPLAKAMLDGYNEVLAQNPNDYQTLYERAAQYYQLSQYDRALLDVTKAISKTPSGKNDLLAQEYSLLADIRMQEKEYDKALEAVNNSLTLNPDSYADVYKKGNICLYLNRPEDAYRCFSQMQKYKSRSQEAYFGMAKADIMMGKLTDAQELMEQAEKADPGNAVTYCRLGDLAVDMKNNRLAARHYIAAFALADSGNSRPLESLLRLGQNDYQAVAEAFDSAISQTDNKLPLYFLKANIANRAGAYKDAEEAFSQLLNDPEGRQGGVYAAYARALLALDRKAEAVEAADKAVQAQPTVSNYALLSDCLLASGDASQAALTALKAYAADEHSVAAMRALARAQRANGNPQEAVKMLNEMVVINPEDVESIALRADIKEKELKDGSGAKADWQRGANIAATTPDARIFVALCKNRCGKVFDADGVIEDVAGDADRNIAYGISAYYTSVGNKSKAQEWRDRAVSLGYGNLYHLNNNIGLLEM